MGSCIIQKQQQALSPELRQKAQLIFQKMDINNSGTVDKEETLKFWKTNFAKLNTEALFNAVNFDKTGEITVGEWLAFWEIVKKSGHTEQEISEELFNLMEGKAWVQFRRVDAFIKRDLKKSNSTVKSIVDGEKRRLSGVGLLKSPYAQERMVQSSQLVQSFKMVQNTQDPIYKRSISGEEKKIQGE